MNLRNSALVVLGIALLGTASPAPSAAPSPAVVIHIKQFAYQPLTVVINVGQTIEWINDDSVEHSVTANDASFDSGELAQGKTWTKTFAKAGTYAYYCDDHRFMKAEVKVKPEVQP